MNVEGIVRWIMDRMRPIDRRPYICSKCLGVFHDADAYLGHSCYVGRVVL